EVVDIGGISFIWLHRLPEGLGPPDVLVTVRRIVPHTNHDQVKFGVALTEGRFLFSYPVNCTPQLFKRHLCEGRGYSGNLGNKCFKGLVAEVPNKAGFPVVVPPGRKHWPTDP